MAQSSIEQALLAVIAARGGDKGAAAEHIAQARAQTRAAARRDRQIIEIAALEVAGERARAVGLAQEHTTEFPDDAHLLSQVAPTEFTCNRSNEPDVMAE